MWSNQVLCVKMPLVAKMDSACANQTYGLLYQNWGSFSDMVLTAGTELKACRALAVVSTLMSACAHNVTNSSTCRDPYKYAN